MIWWVVLPLALALFALRFLRPNALAWAAAWWLALWVFFDFGFAVPIPSSVVKLFMGIITLAILSYISADSGRLREVRRPVFAFLTERRFAPLLVLAAVAVPAAVAAKIYLDATAPPQPPGFGRTIHPAPPQQIVVHGRDHDLTTLDNPLRRIERSNPQDYARRVAEGRRVYYQNCFFCHGDLMQGEGIYAHALNPLPTDFQDSGTIAQLQESYLFWRVARGAPGLPDEAGPWMSAMPAWEQFLTEDEMWDVVAFLYDFTGHRPRALHAEAPVTLPGSQ
jgi:mono/diheme cytochrome c family protein